MQYVTSPLIYSDKKFSLIFTCITNEFDNLVICLQLSFKKNALFSKSCCRQADILKYFKEGRELDESLYEKVLQMERLFPLKWMLISIKMERYLH